MNEFKDKFDNLKIDSNNVLKKVDEWDHLFLTRKLKNLILFKMLNDFSLILKSLSHNNR